MVSFKETHGFIPSFPTYRTSKSTTSPPKGPCRGSPQEPARGSSPRRCASRGHAALPCPLPPRFGAAPGENKHLAPCPVCQWSCSCIHHTSQYRLFRGAPEGKHTEGQLLLGGSVTNPHGLHRISVRPISRRNMPHALRRAPSHPPCLWIVGLVVLAG